MRHSFTNGLLAGVTAATIWIAIGLWLGSPLETVGMWALVLLVGVALVTAVINTVIARGHREDRIDR